MTESISERDLITLNAYLDGELTAEERTAFESRLAGEPALRAELSATRETVALMGMAERIHAPRNFTLDPARYGKPARVSFWDRLGIPAAAAAAVGTVVILLLCVGAFAIFGPMGAPPGIGQVAMEQAAAPADMAAKEAEEEPAEEAYEAPAEAAPPEPEALMAGAEEEEVAPAAAAPAAEAEMPMAEEPAAEEALPAEEPEVQAEAAALDEEAAQTQAPSASLPTSSPPAAVAGGGMEEGEAGVPRAEEENTNEHTASPAEVETPTAEILPSTATPIVTPTEGPKLPFTVIAIIAVGIGLLVLVGIAAIVIMRAIKKR